MGKIKRCGDQITADYIVVGSGHASCILEAKLTDDLKTSVVGIEAGQNHDDDPIIVDPANIFLEVGPLNPIYLWQVTPLGEPNLDFRNVAFQAGRMLGGSGSHNGDQFVRPTVASLQDWESASGSSLWGPNNAIFNGFKQYEQYLGATGYEPA